MAKFLRRNGLTLALTAMFFASLLGHWLTGWRTAQEDLQQHGQPTVSLLAYLADPTFLSTLFENWESEFLQMAVYVVLTAYLVQQGSAESKDPDAPERDVLPSRNPDAPALARVRGFQGWLYAHSLGLALSLLFIVSLALHLRFSAQAAAQQALLHGASAPTVWTYLCDAGFWFESFQNWQSEFLSTAVLVVLSIFLRQKGSPESKGVAAAHSQTGT